MFLFSFPDATLARKCYKMLKWAIKAETERKKYVKWRLMCNQQWARCCLFLENDFSCFFLSFPRTRVILVSFDMSRGAQRRCSVLFEDVVEICTKNSITNEIFGETTHPSMSRRLEMIWISLCLFYGEETSTADFIDVSYSTKKYLKAFHVK